MDPTIQIYVTNLSQFEQDQVSIGAWFQLPVSLEEVHKKLQMEPDDHYEIEDWEAPFRLLDDGEIQVLLNRLAILAEEKSDSTLFPYIEEIIELGVFESLEDGLIRLNELTYLEEKPIDQDLLARAYELSDGTCFIA
ncbi:antirestriction protein ArdA [Listeria monocytogenes]|nr:antirestriction protein ArdA [Listeria monocytogenes]